MLCWAVLGGAAAPAAATPAAARAANSRGYALHKQKKYAEAAVEYRKAIVEDPSYVFAHYNLACVASLTKDPAAAIHELEWLVDRALWDSDAKAAIVKARKDRDLAWLFQQGPEAGMVTSDDMLARGLYDLLDDKAADVVGQPTSDPKLLATLAAAPGKHDAACSNAAYSLEKAGATVVASLRDGVALIDAAGKLVARVEPDGCVGPRAHPSRLVETAAVEKGAIATDGSLLSARLVVMMYLGADAVDHVALFVITHDHKLARAFDMPILSKAGDGTLQQTQTLGTLLYKAPGDPKLRAFQLDRDRWKYVEEK